jgi:hypothetical protein
MAINYYSSIDLLQNQLIKPRIQNETSDAATLEVVLTGRYILIQRQIL